MAKTKTKDEKENKKQKTFWTAVCSRCRVGPVFASHAYSYLFGMCLFLRDSSQNNKIKYHVHIWWRFPPRCPAPHRHHPNLSFITHRFQYWWCAMRLTKWLLNHLNVVYRALWLWSKFLLRSLGLCLFLSVWHCLFIFVRLFCLRCLISFLLQAIAHARRLIKLLFFFSCAPLCVPSIHFQSKPEDPRMKFYLAFTEERGRCNTRRAGIKRTHGDKLPHTNCVFKWTEWLNKTLAGHHSVGFYSTFFAAAFFFCILILFAHRKSENIWTDAVHKLCYCQSFFFFLFRSPSFSSRLLYCDRSSISQLNSRRRTGVCSCVLMLAYLFFFFFLAEIR